MKRFLIIIGCISIICNVATSQQYVPRISGGGTGGNIIVIDATGSITNLASAISAASNGDTIKWKAASYTPSAGAITINKNNLTIEAYGVTLNAVDQTDTNKITITGNGNTIKGLTIDGKYVNAGSAVNAGLIDVQGANTTLIDCTAKQTAGIGFRFSQAYSGSKVVNCIADSCQTGFRTAAYTAGIDGIEFWYCTAQNGRNIGTSLGGFKMSTEGNGGTIRNLKIIGCTARNNANSNTNSLGYELFGSFDGAILSNNYAAQNSFGISIATSCINIVVNNNTLRSGSFCALEFADNLAGANNSAIGNTLIAKDESDAASQTNASGAALSISNNTGNTNTGLLISNNTLVSTVRAIKVRNVDGVTLKGNYINQTSTGEAPIQILYSNDITIESNRTLMPSNSSYIGVWCAQLPSATSTNFRIKDNRFDCNVATGNYPAIYFYVASGSATFSDVRIERNITNITNAASGFIGVAAGVTLNATYNNNIPENITSASGFPLSSSQYILLVDEKANGTFGGALPSTSTWFTRDLNTIKVDTTGAVSIGSNQFTLPAGTYRYQGRVPCLGLTIVKARLYNVTDSSITGYLGNGYAGSEGVGDSGITMLYGAGRFTITSSKTFRIEFWSSATNANTWALGHPGGAGAGGVETYSTLELIRE